MSPAMLLRRRPWRLVLVTLAAGALATVVLSVVAAFAAQLTVNGGTLQVFTFSVGLGPIPATVDIDPDSLNPNSQGNFVMAYIELPDGFDVADILVSTVVLTVEGAEGSVPALAHPTEIGDYDSDGVPDLMVKFDRQAVLELLEGKSGDVTVVVSGQLSGGRVFQGSDVIDVIDPPEVATATPEPSVTPTPTASATATATPPDDEEDEPDD